MKKKYLDWSKEELIKEVFKLEKRKKYGISWEPKEEKVVDLCKEKLPVLKEDLKKEIRKGDSKNTNILIEGDNYHALSVLNYTHKGMIDVIYIDPPYNTGKKDFIFNDHYVDEEDTYRHSKWLSFMYKRLRLAKNLLKRDGVIFVSIDDNELAQLKLLMDEVFDKNFVALYIHKNNSSKNQANLVSISTEYLLLYKKTKDGLKNSAWKTPKKGASDIAKMFQKLKNKGLKLEEIEAQIKDMYSRPKYMHLSRWNKVDKDGVFKDADLSREGGSKNYTIINPNTKKPCVIPKRGWGKSYEELLRLQKEDLIWYGDENTPPGLKDYITSEDQMVPDSLLYFDNSVDTRMIKDMFGKLVFENPKPMEMIKTIVRMSGSSNAIILDFFAGSGTTGQAILDLNKEDGKNRTFILCTDNENNIATDVCHPRIKKVIEGYVGIHSKKKVLGLGGHFKYFKTDFVDANSTDENKRKLVDESTEMLCLKEGVFDELKKGKDFRLFTKENSKYLAIIYSDEGIEPFKKEVKRLNKKFIVYVFSLDESAREEEFEDVKKLVELKPIPAVILNVYKRIFK